MNKYTETYLSELQKNAFIGKALSAAYQAGKPALGAAYQAAKPIVVNGAKDIMSKAKPIVNNYASKLPPKVQDFMYAGVDGAQTTTRGLSNIFKDQSLGKIDKIKKSVRGMYGFPLEMAVRAGGPQLGAKEMGFITGAALPAALTTSSAISAYDLAKGMVSPPPPPPPKSWWQ